jgi:hypothetical protein
MTADMPLTVLKKEEGEEIVDATLFSVRPVGETKIEPPPEPAIPTEKLWLKLI